MSEEVDRARNHIQSAIDSLREAEVEASARKRRMLEEVALNLGPLIDSLEQLDAMEGSDEGLP
jgi:hypothetical protein